MTNETVKTDIAIVGGGIMGLSCAHAILTKFPQYQVVVFEKENYLGEHTTGRNSEVLHAGIYYPTNSLKHIHCIKGNQLWRRYIQSKNMSFLDCGKFIVGTSDQKEALEKLFEHSQKNNVPGMRRLQASEIKILKEDINIDEGFYSPSSGVLNVPEALHFLKEDIESMGGIILTNSRVELLESTQKGFRLNVNGDQILTENLINTAGLFAIEFRKSLSLVDYENFYVKGSYLKLTKKLKLNKLIYPIPPPHGLGLGVHLTLDTSGDQKFGPDTEVTDKINYALDESFKNKITPSIHSIFKNISDEDLQLAYAGIRPKIKKQGQLVPDFVFNTPREHSIKGYFEFLGIESPGITAAPSLALLLTKEL